MPTENYVGMNVGDIFPIENRLGLTVQCIEESVWTMFNFVKIGLTGVICDVNIDGSVSFEGDALNEYGKRMYASSRRFVVVANAIPQPKNYFDE
jgi:hypothetical protein